jgi:hypothetical protein
MKTKLFCAVALSVSLRLFAGSPADGGFVAHEWGTFTSVQGSDGVQVQWNPFTKTDLPKFVYSRLVPTAQGGKSLDLKSIMMSYVRMETPVIYFYSDKGLTADVTVEMPQGRITEWYPRATRVGPSFTTNKAEAKEASRSLIEWKGVHILPRDTTEISVGKLIREKSGDHYYEAREVDANFVRVPSPHESTGAEYERDLFYRGIGFFQAPLTVRTSGDGQSVQCSTKGSEPMTDLFVLTVRDGKARYQTIAHLRQGEETSVTLANKPFVPLSEVRAQLMREMSTALVKQGLYAKEAEAMVQTWKDQWFAEEGTRVLYLLPPTWTDKTLPLTISPKPNSVVRVMVGRAEVIPQTMERELNRQITIYSKGDSKSQAQAIAQVQKLGIGRFLEPATRMALGKNPSKEISQAGWKLAAEVSKAQEEKSSGVVGKELPGKPKETAAL